MNGLEISLFVKCKSFRPFFLVILLSLDLSLSLPDFFTTVHAHLDHVEMLKTLQYHRIEWESQWRSSRRSSL